MKFKYNLADAWGNDEIEIKINNYNNKGKIHFYCYKDNNKKTVEYNSFDLNKEVINKISSLLEAFIIDIPTGDDLLMKIFDEAPFILDGCQNNFLIELDNFSTSLRFDNLWSVEKRFDEKKIISNKTIKLFYDIKEIINKEGIDTKYFSLDFLN